MKSPECNRTDCRFVHGAGFQTAMWSPIEYDKDGKPVGGGHNSETRSMSCRTCGKNWRACGSELQFAQDVVEWEELSK